MQAKRRDRWREERKREGAVRKETRGREREVCRERMSSIEWSTTQMASTTRIGPGVPSRSSMWVHGPKHLVHLLLVSQNISSELDLK